jgi:glutamate-ammonia-ligase adenylyltransferase
MRAPETVALLGDDRALELRSRAALETEMTALAQRASDAEQAVTAIRGVRRRELFRIVAADLLGMIEPEGAATGPATANPAAPNPVTAWGTAGMSDPPSGPGGLGGFERRAGGDRLDRLGWALTDLTAATLEATLRAVCMHRSARHAGEPLPTRFAVIAMGRFGGGELGYGSDADVLFVHEPIPGADEQAASEAAFDIANELRRLLQAPAADPPLLIDADLRPEGRQGPLVRSLAAYAEYYRRWSRVWESQALLRATPVAGDAGVGARFVELVDPIRYPADGLSEVAAREIRRLKARMEAERLPRGADRALHTKLGPGGLSDVEWAVQLLQLQYGGQDPALRTTGTRAAMRAAVAAGLLADEDRALLEAAWCESTRMRNGITVVRGRPGDQVPTSPRELAGIGRYFYSWGPDVPGSPDFAAPGAYEAQGAHGTRGYGYSGDSGANAGQSTHRLDNEALLDMHRRTTRRARAVFERRFYG